jgi:hypothetical protein
LVLPQTFEGILLQEDVLQNSVSSSPKKKTKWDFRVEFHGAIILLCPLTSPGCAWVQRHIGADNGYQPYYPTAIIEPRFIDDVLVDIRKQGLVAR